MNHLLPFQVIFSVLVVYFIWRVLSKKNSGVLKTSELFGWLVIWLLVLLALWWPGTLSTVATFLGIGRGVDLAIYLAIVLQFFLIFRLFVKVDRQQQEITVLTRNVAISKVEYERSDE